METHGDPEKVDGVCGDSHNHVSSTDFSENVLPQDASPRPIHGWKVQYPSSEKYKRKA